jgi:dihydrofolate reductase
MKPLISIITAVSENGVIGKDNHLPWSFPEDLKYFRETTRGHVVIMGRKTYESMGQALPNRVNIVISRDKNYTLSDALTTLSLDTAIKLAKEKEKNEVFIIGGASIYAQALPLADKLYITKIKGVYEGDTYFPDYAEFKTVLSEKKSTDGNLVFLILSR